jgi:hypothetical protein
MPGFSGRACLEDTSAPVSFQLSRYGFFPCIEAFRANSELFGNDDPHIPRGCKAAIMGH